MNKPNFGAWAELNYGISTRKYRANIQSGSHCPICHQLKSVCWKTGDEDLATPGSPLADLEVHTQSIDTAALERNEHE
jgi:hypothetical protein